MLAARQSSGATLGQLYASVFWARRDTRTPLRFALVRVALGARLGWLLAFRSGPFGLPRSLGLPAYPRCQHCWLDRATLLRRAAEKLLGRVGLPLGFALRCWGAALAAAVPALGLKLVLGALPPLLAGFLVCTVFGLGYLALASGLGIAEVTAPLAALGLRKR